MEINKKVEGNNFAIELKGRLDSNTAPVLEKELEQHLVGVNHITLDLKELDYISSAGLRVLLSLHKAMLQCDGNLVITNVKDEVMEVFEVTGFNDILNFE